ncbi:asparagine synthase (glutamine-hydrolyzing) [Streptomyces sp. NPDC050856]|uniref:asparagine synthase (glutamine-hydrolyzing) n=1 Tax=Streptomyces sp. NPDC050856 TaxID=3154939 RepID=UPI0033E95712
MCGIAGWVDWEADLTARGATLASMVGTMACPGTDVPRHLLSPRAALGECGPAGRRSGGDGAVTEAGPGSPEPAVVVFDGEIHNGGELRSELERRGCVFRGASDTELVLRAYLTWGEGAFDRFAGMYAFAVWDTRSQALLLVRDRLGITPLYWTRRDGRVLFGSRPRAVLAHPLFPAEVDAEGLAALFTVAIKPPGAGVYRDLAEVRPGHVVRVDRAGARQRRYWRLRAEPHPDDLPATVAEVRRLLGAAIGEQLVSDVPLVALLSGGIDSSAIVALAARRAAARGGGRLATYSLDFAGGEEDFRPDALHASRDAPFVRAVTDHVGTDHTEVVVAAPSLVDELGSALRARDMPGVGDLDVSLLLLFREVREHAAVALSGEGADDLFGGYPWFRAEAERATTNFPWSRGVTDRNAQLSPELRAVLDLDAYVADTYADALAEVPRLEGESGADRRLREVFHLQLTRFLPFLLDRQDRMSRANGLAVRLPFCDHRLVEYLWNVPWEFKRAGGRDKGLLRSAVADLLPPEVVERPKSGFPVGQSPAYLEGVRRAVREIVDDPSSPVLGLVDARAVRSMVDSDAWFSGTFTPPPWLPRVIQLDQWLREYRVAVVL